MAFFPVILPWFPCYARNGSLLFAIGNIPKILMNAALLDDAGVFQRAFLWFSLYFFPVIEKIRVRRQVRLRLAPPPRSLTQTEISRLGANSPQLAGFVREFCLCNLLIGFQGPVRGLVWLCRDSLSDLLFR
jgi:hypothetical protein